MKIYGLQKTSLLDYPGKIATIVFIAGCNLRCPYCQNMEVVTSDGRMGEAELFAHLEKRRHTIEGVVLTGGEPTLQRDLPALCQRIKALGLSVKLDTNGTSPALLRHLVQSRLVDYVAMDIKGGRASYGRVTGLAASSLHDYIMDIEASVSFLLSDAVPYEFRTTVVSELHDEEDFADIGEWIAGAKAYYLQPFVRSEFVPQQTLTSPSLQTLEHYRDILLPRVPGTQLRGV